MAKEATRMSTLVNDLLSLTRIERIEHSPPSETVELGKIQGVLSKFVLIEICSRKLNVSLL